MALMWSVITLKEISKSLSSPYFFPETFAISSIISFIASISKIFSVFCKTVAILSSPIPVSIFGCESEL